MAGSCEEDAPNKRQRTFRVYVAGPISLGEPAYNVRQAVDAAEALLIAGAVPFVPQLMGSWEEVHPHTHAEWMRYDAAWLSVCDALVRLPGESVGSDAEVA